jgi:hypothetical protein
MTYRAIRRAQREYYNTPDSSLLAKIFRDNKRLAAQYSTSYFLK